MAGIFYYLKIYIKIQTTFVCGIVRFDVNNGFYTCVYLCFIQGDSRKACPIVGGYVVERTYKLWWLPSYLKPNRRDIKMNCSNF